MLCDGIVLCWCCDMLCYSVFWGIDRVHGCAAHASSVAAGADVMTMTMRVTVTVTVAWPCPWQPRLTGAGRGRWEGLLFQACKCMGEGREGEVKRCFDVRAGLTAATAFGQQHPQQHQRPQQIDCNYRHWPDPLLPSLPCLPCPAGACPLCLPVRLPLHAESPRPSIHFPFSFPLPVPVPFPLPLLFPTSSHLHTRSLAHLHTCSAHNHQKDASLMSA
jgi:hypothetical protein